MLVDFCGVLTACCRYLLVEFYILWIDLLEPVRFNFALNSSRFRVSVAEFRPELQDAPGVFSCGSGLAMPPYR